MVKNLINTYLQFISKDFNINRLNNYILSDYQIKNSQQPNFRIYSKTILNINKPHCIIDSIEKYIIFDKGVYKDSFSQKLNYIYISIFYFDINDTLSAISKIVPDTLYTKILEESDRFKMQVNSHKNVEFTFHIDNILYLYDILLLQIENVNDEVLSIDNLNPCYNYITQIDNSYYYSVLYNIVSDNLPMFVIPVPTIVTNL